MNHDPPSFSGSEEKILRRIPVEVLILAFCLALSAVILFDAATAVFVAAGGAAAAVSFVWLKKSVSRFLFSGKGRAVRSAVLLYGLRLLLIIAIFSIIIILFSKKIIAFIIGFSMVVPVLFTEAGIALLKMKQWKN
ncbi:MAG: ATP synthase subunit I [Candidatus Aminicenantes bacterium]|nr:ATP synthase subunit I [Candidatus Aminicenantes bacterium]